MGESQYKVKVWVAQSRPTLCDPMDCSGVAKRVLCPWNSPGKNTGVGHHSLFQRIFSTQESNLGLLHCRQIFSFFFFLQSDPLSDEENYIFSGVGSHSLLQSIFSTQESNPGLLHCRQIFFTLWAAEPPRKLHFLSCEIESENQKCYLCVQEGLD